MHNAAPIDAERIAWIQLIDQPIVDAAANLDYSGYNDSNDVIWRCRMRRIIIHRSEPDEDVAYWVECPSLGIASMGDTIEEAIAMIREAIDLHIEDLVANGDPVPPEDMPELPVTQELVIEP